MGRVQADDSVGGHVLHASGLKRLKGLLQAVGGREAGLAEPVGDGPGALRGNLGGEGGTGILGGNARVGAQREQGDARGQVGGRAPEIAVARGVVDAEHHVHRAVGECPGRVAAHIHHRQLQPQLVGESRGDVHVDSDDLAAAHTGQRRVLGVDAHAQGALLADDRGRHLGGLQLRLIGARSSASGQAEQADREQRRKGNRNERTLSHIILRLIQSVRCLFRLT